MPLSKVALVHDWLTGMRGGEKVLEVLCDLFPGADIFTLVHIPGQVSESIERHRIITSSLQKVPQIDRHYRHLLPVMPWAIEQFYFTGYDLLISTSHCVAKGALRPSGAVHWCYCHTPMRYIWDQFDDYFGPGHSTPLVRSTMRRLRPRLQRWDISATDRVDHFMANSENVRQRIQRIYHRDAIVVYPPVDYEFYSHPTPPPQGGRAQRGGGQEPYYLVVSAFAPYKRIDLAIQAFNANGRRLRVVGDGQDSKALRKMAKSNIEFLGWLDQGRLRELYASCKALIFPGEEDFGLVPLEAMATGRPVIAYQKGGALETIEDGKTGIFFAQQSPEALNAAIERLGSLPFDPLSIRQHAERFGRTHCESRFRQLFVEYADQMS